ncbi:hypothetical protein Si021_01501 [Streptococcus infantarius subsp. infantarius]|nr:hypothetical protein [Streptococcus infantarius subsp. infantarius]MCO4654081.1 hypothetical protein [Streptococcus infantarius subsp. infantarius]MCO4659686.1 hypothetical protein [Streptococcus infantarius subsp. infantarius]MCO4661716.1 hypothetical protein [Streptococcus infantarius subsp. infantarius]MCO4662403.1 hypothetical protein [Streptococcus infantarius subsp. infantarius]
MAKPIIRKVSSNRTTCFVSPKQLKKDSKK